MADTKFPIFPEGLSDEWLNRAGRSMVLLSKRTEDDEASVAWHLLGAWLLDVVDHRRQAFDEVAGPAVAGVQVESFDEALRLATAELRSIADGDTCPE